MGEKGRGQIFGKKAYAERDTERGRWRIGIPNEEKGKGAPKYPQQGTFVDDEGPKRGQDATKETEPIWKAKPTLDSRQVRRETKCSKSSDKRPCNPEGKKRGGERQKVRERSSSHAGRVK